MMMAVMMMMMIKMLKYLKSQYRLKCRLQLLQDQLKQNALSSYYAHSASSLLSPLWKHVQNPCHLNLHTLNLFNLLTEVTTVYDIDHQPQNWENST